MDTQGEVSQHRCAAIAEGDLAALRSVEFDFRFSRDLFCLRLFVQDRKYTRTGGDCILQSRSQARQCRNRTKRGKERQYRDQKAVKTHLSGRVEPPGADCHQHIKYQYKGIGDRQVKASQAVQRILVPQKDFGLLVHGSHTAAAAVILDRLIETADILQNAGGEVRGVLAHFLSHVAADPGDNKRNNNADTQIGGQSQKPQACMECADIDTHDRRGHKRDADRRDRMRVEHLKKLHIGSDQGDKVSLVLSLELGRAESSERAEHFVPHEREQSKGNIVIETLLREPEDRP